MNSLLTEEELAIQFVFSRPHWFYQTDRCTTSQRNSQIILSSPTSPPRDGSLPHCRCLLIFIISLLTLRFDRKTLTPPSSGRWASLDFWVLQSKDMGVLVYQVSHMVLLPEKLNGKNNR